MKSRIWLIVLTVLVVFSLALNGYLVVTLLNVRHTALDAITTARNNLASLGSQPFVTQVNIDQEIPFNTVVPIDQTFSVPLNIEYPLSTVVNTYVNIPVLGRQEIALPIETTIPIQYTLDVPVAVDVPISLTYHLQTEVPVEVVIPPEIRAPLDEVLQQIQVGLQ